MFEHVSRLDLVRCAAPTRSPRDGGLREHLGREPRVDIGQFSSSASTATIFLLGVEVGRKVCVKSGQRRSSPSLDLRIGILRRYFCGVLRRLQW
jgi:hypothetical protein